MLFIFCLFFTKHPSVRRITNQLTLIRFVSLLILDITLSSLNPLGIYLQILIHQSFHLLHTTPSDHLDNVFPRQQTDKSYQLFQKPPYCYLILLFHLLNDLYRLGSSIYLSGWFLYCQLIKSSFKIYFNFENTKYPLVKSRTLQNIFYFRQSQLFYYHLLYRQN